MTDTPSTPANPAQGVSDGVPSIDLMRDAAKGAFTRYGWKYNDHLSPHSAIELMAAFAIEVIKSGEGRCGWPSCGCDYDASCVEAIPVQAVAHVLPSELGWLDEPDHLGEPHLRKKPFERLNGEKSVPLYTHPAPSGQAVAQLGGAPDDLRNLIKITFADMTIERMAEVSKAVVAARDPALPNTPAQPGWWEPDKWRSKLNLWFFRDLSDEQRLKLFSLFELPVDEIGRVHSHQRKALDHCLPATPSEGR